MNTSIGGTPLGVAASRVVQWSVTTSNTSNRYGDEERTKNRVGKVFRFGGIKVVRFVCFFYHTYMHTSPSIGLVPLYL